MQAAWGHTGEGRSTQLVALCGELGEANAGGAFARSSACPGVTPTRADRCVLMVGVAEVPTWLHNCFQLY